MSDELTIRRLGRFARKRAKEGLVRTTGAILDFMPEDLSHFEHTCHEFGHAYADGLAHERGMYARIGEGWDASSDESLASEAAAWAFTVAVFRRLGLSEYLPEDEVEEGARIQGVEKDLLELWLEDEEPEGWADDFIEKYGLGGEAR